MIEGIGYTAIKVHDVAPLGNIGVVDIHLPDIDLTELPATVLGDVVKRHSSAILSAHVVEGKIRIIVIHAATVGGSTYRFVQCLREALALFVG